MKRYAVLSTIVLLLTLNWMPGSANAAWLSLPETSTQQARLDVLEAGADQTVLRWEVGDVEISAMEDGTPVYNLAGLNRSVDGEQVPSVGRLVRLPWGHSATMQIVAGTATHISAEGTILESIPLAEAPVELDRWGALGQAGILRDVTVAPLTLEPVQPMEDGSVWVASDLHMVLNTEGRLANAPRTAPDRPVSRAFWPIYRTLVADNLDDLGLRLADTKGSYLIITSGSYVASLENFIQWKRQKGYNVILHTFTDGITYEQVRNLVHDQYLSADPALEFVLLVGDVNRGGAAAIPSDFIVNPNDASENDVTDWSYAMIEGNDYFPEVLIGRMTVGSATESFKVSSRVVKYEQNTSNIPTDDPYWDTSVLVAANYSEGGATPLTPVATTQWLHERMTEDWGVSNSFLFPWETSGTQSTADDIISAMNQSGALWVSYRGWGNATGWVEPDFNNADVARLNNPSRLAVLTSFVCNTGDFGNDLNPECFGEKWLNAGTPTVPTGAVAVVAPSDLHTQTAYNNALLAGFYTGIYNENLSNISQALVRGKMEIYNGFPGNRVSGQEVEFYWHVYHVLGDPEMTVWRRAPRTLTATMPEDITLGQDYLDVTVTGSNGPLHNAYVQVMQGDEVFSGGYTDESGVANVPLTGVTLGEDVQVTITRADYLPSITTHSVVQAPRYVGIATWDADAGSDGLVSPQETVNLVVTLRNDGSEAVSGVSATLSSPDPEFVSVGTSEASFGDLAPGAEASNGSSAFTFTMNQPAPDGAAIELNLAITDADAREWTSKVWVPIGTSQFQYQSSAVVSGDYVPGSSASLEFEVDNIGSLLANNMTVTLQSWDEAVTVDNGEVTGVTIPAGGSLNVGPFDVSVDGATYRGRVVRLQLEFATSSGDFVDRISFNVPLSGAQGSDPYGPDSYGYFVYDDTDSNQEAPTFTWYDLANDGSATTYLLNDDANVTADLPFDVRFYGTDYPAGGPLTISSNGWVSFKEESHYTVNFFRNWPIPSSLGPNGMIAAFWDDLKQPTSANQMRVRTRYDQAEGRFIIEWSDALNRFGWGTTDYPEQFEVVIYSQEAMPTTTGDNVIEVHYNAVENVDQHNNYATVGIMNRNRSAGLQYTYANEYPAACPALQSGRALRFTTNAPDDLNGVDNEVVDASSPDDFVLYPTYPNPFNAATEIKFDLPQDARVRLSVYNLLGQEIAVLIDRPMTSGRKQVVWQVNDLNLSSGLLLVRLQADSRILWTKMMYVK